MKTETQADPEQLQMIEPERQICRVRYSRDGKYFFAASYDAVIRVWQVTDEEPQALPPITGHHGWVQELVVHPAEDVIFSADSWGGLQATRFAGGKAESLWSLPDAHDGWIRSVALSTDGKFLATCGHDRAVRVWSTADGNRLHEFTGHQEQVQAVAIHPDGRTVVSGDMLGRLCCWDLQAGKCTAETTIEKMHLLDNIHEMGGIRVLQFEPDGKMLRIGGGEPVRTNRSIAIPSVYELAWPSLEVKQTIALGDQSQGYVFDMCPHPDGYLAVVTSGQPGKGQFLGLAPGEEKPIFNNTKLSNCHSIDVRADGRIIIAATNRSNQGNGAVKDKDGNYKGNYSPLYVFGKKEEAAAS